MVKKEVTIQRVMGPELGQISLHSPSGEK